MKVKVVLPLLFFLIGCLLLLKFIGEFKWFLNSTVPTLKFLHYFTIFYLPFVFFGLCYIPKKHSKWRLLFRWEVWYAPFMLIVLFAVSQWRFDWALNHETQLLGYSWQWNALAVWPALLLIQLFLYQKRGLGSVHSFALSFFGVMIASIIYELPWRFSVWRWEFLTHPKFFVSMWGLAAILYSYHWKPSKWFLLSLIPLFASWMTFFHSPYWLPRLATFPLFIMLPFGFREKKLGEEVCVHKIKFEGKEHLVFSTSRSKTWVKLCFLLDQLFGEA